MADLDDYLTSRQGNREDLVKLLFKLKWRYISRKESHGAVEETVLQLSNASNQQCSLSCVCVWGRESFTNYVAESCQIFSVLH